MDVLNAFLSKVVVQVVNPIILLLTAIAFVVFLWGVFEFIANAGEATKRAEGKSAILWGLVGLVIIFGVYGIINLALNTFGVTPSQPIHAGAFSNTGQ
jgi:TRAP-type C4-dicarboxylate transport system permease small subunit